MASEWGQLPAQIGSIFGSFYHEHAHCTSTGYKVISYLGHPIVFITLNYRKIVDFCLAMLFLLQARFR